MKQILIIGTDPARQLNKNKVFTSYPIHVPILKGNSEDLIDVVSISDIDFDKFYPWVKDNVDILICNKDITSNETDDFVTLVYRQLEWSKDKVISITRWDELI